MEYEQMSQVQLLVNSDILAERFGAAIWLDKAAIYFDYSMIAEYLRIIDLTRQINEATAEIGRIKELLANRHKVA